MSSTSFEGSSEISSVTTPIGIPTSSETSDQYSLPRKPVITIEAGSSWMPLELRHLWTCRELLYYLIWRDIKVRYKQTVLGALWAILQPLVMMVIFTFFFSKLAKIPTEGIPGPMFYYIGLTLWTFFSNSVMGGANSLLGNTNLITKIYFPRLIIPSASIGAGLIDLAIASALFIPMLAYYGVGLSWKILLLLPLSVILTALALGTGILFAALNVKYRDVRHVLPFLLQAWMFVSPIIYPSSQVPQEWRWVLMMNPFTGILDGFRASLFARPLNTGALLYSTVFAVILLSGSAFAFRRMESTFAELL